MAVQPENDINVQHEAQQLVMGFDRGRFTADNELDRREWVATTFRMAEQRESTRNTMSLILVIAFVSSFPVLGLAMYFLPAMKQEVMTGFTQWLTVIGSLTGAAVGVGATGNRKQP